MPGDRTLDAGATASGDGADSRMAACAAVRRRPSRAGLMMALLGSAACSPAMAQAAAQAVPGSFAISATDVMQLALFAGITGAAMLSAILLIRERGRATAENLELRERVAMLDAALQRSDALLNLKDQRVLVWFADGRKPELLGALASVAPEDRATFLAFGRWLDPRSATALDRAIARLRDEAQPFDLVIETARGDALEAQGRVAANHTVVRFLALTDARREHAGLRLEHQRLRAEHDTLLGLARSLSMPVWLRGGDGRLSWVNPAYARAVDAVDSAAAVDDQKEFLGTAAREQVAHAHLSSPVFAGELSTVVAGDRRQFAVTDYAGGDGSGGLAWDISDTAGIREELERTVRSHADTLDQLNTAVAIFDINQRLKFYNQAFQKLWELDIGFLASEPDHTLLLDRLRSRASSPSSRNGAGGRRTFSAPIAPSIRRNICGTCPTARPCASSPIRSRGAA